MKTDDEIWEMAETQAEYDKNQKHGFYNGARWYRDNFCAQKPVLVWQFKGPITYGSYERIKEQFTKALDVTGWRGIVVDCCDVGEVRAFGVKEEDFEKLESIKKALKIDD